MFQTLSSKFHQMIVLFIILVCAMPAMAAFSKGEGTEASPYEISSVGDLQQLRDGVNTGAEFTFKGYSIAAGGKNAFFILTTDLDLSSVCGANINGKDSSWTPIGNYTNQFKGNFNGNGKTISNLYINAPDSIDQGLFGVMDSSGTISNLGIINGSVSGSNYVGGVCGYNNGAITNSNNSGSVSGQSGIGGVCGYNNGAITNSYNIGSVSGNGFVGGVCGYNYGGTITNSYNIGSVSGNGFVGGVCGKNSNAIRTSYYDKQMCTIGGIDGSDTEDAIGKLTTEMTGSQIFSDTTIWVTADNMYPRLKGMETTDVAIAAATPIFLNYSNAENYETVDSVATNFTVGIGNSVTWSSNNTSRAKVSNESVTLTGKGNVTLIATLHNVSKEIVINSVMGAEINTETNPITIDNVAELQQLRDGVNTGAEFTFKGYSIAAGGKNAFFILTTDLDLSSVCGANINGKDSSWTPIGNYTNQFKGNFNGNGKTISNLYINAPDSIDQGLFGVMDSSGTISNLGIINGSVSGKYDVGGVCGYNYGGTITNSYNIGSVSGNGFVGGVCGENYGSITNSYNSGSVTGTSNYVGGVCGYNYNYGGTISTSYNSGSVSGNQYVGGVCGYNYGGTISISYNSGSVSGDQYVGGVCGWNNNEGKITNSYNTGSVNGTGFNVGGVCGWNNNEGKITNSYNTGSVNGTGFNVGGVCGYNYGGTISTSYNSGSVSGNQYVGGVCGENSGTITNSYNTGSVSGQSSVGGVCGYNSNGGTISTSYNSGSVSGKYDVGGVCGDNEGGTITNSYYDKQMCTIGGINGGDVSGSAEGKLTTEMTGSQIFSDTTIWVTADNMYPRLKGMETTDVAIAAATPIFLNYSNAENYETVDSIATNFTVGMGNDVTWSSKENMVSINNNAVNLVKNGNDTLVCTLDSVTKLIAITVKAKPIISELETPEAVVHGDTLKPTIPTILCISETATGTWQLSATNDFATTIDFASSTVVTYSQNGYYLRYVATNDVGTSYSDTVQITVNKVTPVITWNAPASIVEGTALTKKQLNATADAEGTFTYAPALGSVLKVGSHTLKVTFTPDDSINYESITKEVSITVVEDQIVFADNAVVVNADSYCQGDDVRIAFKISSDNATQYRIIYDADALEQGFTNTDYQKIETAGSAVIEIPSNCNHGTYTAQLQLRNNQVESEAVKFNFMVNISSKYLVRMWDDVISVDNNENNFSNYQWYHNGKAIDGATLPYYCEEGGLTGSYTLSVSQNGESFVTCPFNISTVVKSSTSLLNVYPNPATDVISINNTISIIGKTLTITNASGVVMIKQNINSQPLTIDVSKYLSGVYIIKVNQETQKFIVK